MPHPLVRVGTPSEGLFFRLQQYPKNVIQPIAKETKEKATAEPIEPLFAGHFFTREWMNKRPNNHEKDRNENDCLRY